MTATTIDRISGVGNGPHELYWLAGLLLRESQWLVRAVFRQAELARFHTELLPIGMLPVLGLGNVYDAGKKQSIRMRGIVGTAEIADVSAAEEITSADLPTELYSFDGHDAGVQRLLRYQTAEGKILIPALELIRGLFLQNRLLANAMMRPAYINMLFHPDLPGYRSNLTLRFSRAVPANCLSDQFAREFAWLALDESARQSWDSIYLGTIGNPYVAFNPPRILNSVWKFIGVRHKGSWLVQELLSVSGKTLPCDKLFYSHPALKKIVHVRNPAPAKCGNDSSNSAVDAPAPTTKKEFHFIVEGTSGGARCAGNSRTVPLRPIANLFNGEVEVTRVYDNADSPSQSASTLANSQRHTGIEKVNVIVNADEPYLPAVTQALEFKQLPPAATDASPDLDTLGKAIQALVTRIPGASLAMSLCQLKSGRSFSTVNARPRLALVCLISFNDDRQLALVDVEHTGNISLSPLAMHYSAKLDFARVEQSIKAVLDGLVDSGGRWNRSIEEGLAADCRCERLPWLLKPRGLSGRRQDPALLSMKLYYKLALHGTA
jgi:hypothetical protein